MDFNIKDFKKLLKADDDDYDEDEYDSQNLSKPENN